MKKRAKSLIILALLIVLGSLWVRRLMWVGGVLTPQLHSAKFTRMELEALDAAKQKYLHDHNSGRSDLVALSNLVSYLEGDTNYPGFALQKLIQENGVDWVGNPILIGTNNIAVGGPISDPVRVNPKTKESLKLATGGDAFWGPYE